MTRREEREILIACVLGDGCIRCCKSHGSVSAALYFRHSPSQYDYLAWKINLIESLKLVRGRKFSIKDQLTLHRHTGKTYPQRIARLSYTKYLRILYKWIYPGGRKSVKKVLRYITNPLALAIWFMDDGSINRRKKKHKDGTPYFLKPSSYLCTNGFPYEEVMIIADRLAKVYGVYGTPCKDHSGWRLWFNAENTRKIWEIISPYVMQIPSMQKKFDLCVKFYSSPSSTSARHQ